MMIVIVSDARARFAKCVTELTTAEYECCCLCAVVWLLLLLLLLSRVIFLCVRLCVRDVLSRKS